MRIEYSAVRALPNKIGYLPMLPLALAHSGRLLQVHDLVDSGAMINVLPFRVGLELGVEWRDEEARLTIGGGLARVPSIELELVGQVGEFQPVNLFFAWVKSDDVRLILGQYNFFQEFDVHFYRSKFEFEIHPKLN